jgi:hypothetical protein
MRQDLGRHSSLFPEQRLENPTLNLARLFFASGWMGRDVEPHLKNIRDRDVVRKYARAENRFRVRWYPHGHIGGAGGMIDCETETIQRIERQTFEVYVRRSTANEP